jgi:hypothetical protein
MSMEKKKKKTYTGSHSSGINFSGEGSVNQIYFGFGDSFLVDGRDSAAWSRNFSSGRGAIGSTAQVLVPGNQLFVGDSVDVSTNWSICKYQSKTPESMRG